jgi:hypothetical protein
MTDSAIMNLLVLILTLNRDFENRNENLHHYASKHQLNDAFRKFSFLTETNSYELRLRTSGRYKTCLVVLPICFLNKMGSKSKQDLGLHTALISAWITIALRALSLISRIADVPWLRGVGLAALEMSKRSSIQLKIQDFGPTLRKS